MKYSLLFLVLLLSACSSHSESDKHYYQLQAPLKPLTTSSLKSYAQPRFIWLESVTIAEYLNQSGIVYQLNDVEFVTAEQNLWASPLHEQLTKQTVQNLTTLLPQTVVASQRVAEPDTTLQLYIDQFHGLNSGDVVVSGRWIITNRRGQVSTQPFNLHQAQIGDGYPALVKALSKTWQQELVSLAAQLNR